MIISINEKENLINKFLNPISNISDLSVLTIDSNKITSLNKTADNNVVLFAEIPYSGDSNTKIDLNIPNVKKLIKILETIDGSNVEFTINNNNLEYKSSHTKFKYHLLENGIITIPSINLNKVNSFEWDTEFIITYDKFTQLHKSSTFITDSNKIYFYAENGQIHDELNDHTRSNIDCYSTIIAEGYKGKPIDTPIPLSFDVFRMLYVVKNAEIAVKINSTKGVAIFDISGDGYKLQYITTALVK